MDPKRVVEQGYDRIAQQYLDWVLTEPAEARVRYTQVLLERLPARARVLDLGCGAGLPTTRALAERFRVIGADISARQVALARQNVPAAAFLQADIGTLSLAPESLDGVSAFYSIIHVPREEQPDLLRRIAAWLRPAGLFVATLGARAHAVDYADDFLGAPMYWSSYDADTNRRLVEQAGLRILSAREETTVELGDPVVFLWVVAEKPAASAHGRVCPDANN